MIMFFVTIVVAGITIISTNTGSSLTVYPRWLRVFGTSAMAFTIILCLIQIGAHLS